MLAIRDLKKTYPGGVEALKGVSLEMRPGMWNYVLLLSKFFAALLLGLALAAVVSLAA